MGLVVALPGAPRDKEQAMSSAFWDERYRSVPLVWSRGPNRFVADLCAPLAPGRALDLAAGEGRNAIWLARRGWQVTALDFSAVALGRARELAAADGVELSTQQVDLVTDWEPEPQSADLVVVAYLQLAAAGLSTVLAKAARAVVPGGLLVLVNHDRSNLEHGHGGPPDPAVLSDRDEVVAALGALTVERAEVVRRPVDTPEGSREALDLLVVARA